LKQYVWCHLSKLSWGQIEFFFSKASSLETLQRTSPIIKEFTRGVCHIVALPFTFKSIVDCKRRIMETQNISPCKHKIFKTFSKWNQNPSRCYNSKYQVSTWAKISSFKKLKKNQKKKKKLNNNATTDSQSLGDPKEKWCMLLRSECFEELDWPCFVLFRCCYVWPKISSKLAICNGHVSFFLLPRFENAHNFTHLLFSE